jgi:thioredoxin 1
VVRAFDTPIITSDQSIDRVLAVGQPVLFVFLNGDVSPSLEDTMQHLARENAGQLLVVQVPVKDSPASTRRYQVGRTPAVVTIRQGQVLTKAEAASSTDLERHAAFLLGRGPRPETTPPAHGSAAARPTHASADGARPRAATDLTFEQEVMRSPQPVLLDFWAPWCGPCRMTEPILEKLAGEMAGRLRVVKVNVDENPASAQRYDVQSIPTMMLVKNGRVVDRWVGALPEGALRNRVAVLLGN